MIQQPERGADGTRATQRCVHVYGLWPKCGGTGCQFFERLSFVNPIQLVSTGVHVVPFDQEAYSSSHASGCGGISGALAAIST
jgi:hypothetical protein